MSQRPPFPSPPGGFRPAAAPRAPVAPHPALRRLYALGGAPARLAQALARVQAALERVAREPEHYSLLDDGPAGALAAGPDLAALFERLLPDATAPDAGELERAPAPRHRSAGAGASAGERGERGERAEPAHGHEPIRSLEPRSREIGRVVRRAAPVVGRVARAATATAAPAGAPHGAPASTASPRARAVAAAGGAAGPSRRVQAPDAVESLRRRALRAGAPGAADSPLVLAPSDPELVARLLSAGAPGGGGGSVPAAGAAAPGAPAGEAAPHSPPGASSAGASSAGAEAAPAAGAAARLVRVLERLGPGRALAAGPRAGPAGGGGAARRPRPAAAEGAGARAFAAGRFDDASAAGETPPASGLRRLLALSGEAELPRDSLRAPAAPENPRTGLTGVVDTRLRDVELGESLERLLRREARRQGIDLEGLGA